MQYHLSLTFTFHLNETLDYSFPRSLLSTISNSFHLNETLDCSLPRSATRDCSPQPSTRHSTAPFHDQQLLSPSLNETLYSFPRSATRHDQQQETAPCHDQQLLFFRISFHFQVSLKLISAHVKGKRRDVTHNSHLSMSDR